MREITQRHSQLVHGTAFRLHIEYEWLTAGKIAQRGSAQIIHSGAQLIPYDQRIMSPAY